MSGHGIPPESARGDGFGPECAVGGAWDARIPGTPDVGTVILPPVPPFEPGPRTRAGLYRTKREALKYLGLAVLFGAVLWTATLIVYLIFSGKAHG